MDYFPNKWVILKITSEYGKIYKVLAHFDRGDYFWRLNSGIDDVDYTVLEDYEQITYQFFGNSGSLYWCPAELEGFTTRTQGIYLNLKDNEDSRGYKVEVVPFDKFIIEFRNKGISK